MRWCGWPARSIGGFLDRRFASVCTPGPGQPGLPTRLVAGLFILKHMRNLLPILLRRAELLPQTAVRPLVTDALAPAAKTEEQLMALIQESLAVAHKTGALATRDLERVVVDTTVQPKAIAHPTDARIDGATY
jgi:IS5 family transposase